MEKIGLIIDMEYFVGQKNKLIPREVCIVKVESCQYFHLMINLKGHFPDLKEKKTNWFISKVLTGLPIYPYIPKEQKFLIDYKDFDNTVKNIIKNNTTPTRSLVAYKGGTIERDLLTKLNVPSIDLETCGCPKVYNFTNDHCGMHMDLYDKSREMHCAFIDVFLYREWLLEKLNSSSLDNFKTKKMFKDESVTNSLTFSDNYSIVKSENEEEEIWLFEDDMVQTTKKLNTQDTNDCFWIDDPEEGY